MPKTASGVLIPGKLSPLRAVPKSITRPEYVGNLAPSPHVGGDRYSDSEILRIRKSSKIAAQALEMVLGFVKPGVSTDELDRIGHDFIVGQGGYPSTLGYRGFPKSLCSSVNEVICHGIPDDTVLEDGDLVNIDISAYFDGMHGDTNGTVVVGSGSQEVIDLVKRTEEATMRGIKAALPGREVNIIGRAIESYAKRFGYGVVQEFTGHGVGSSFHTGLIIPHYDAPEFSTKIELGMVFTVEPMLTLGTREWDMWEDDWTVTTKDKKYTAQFEHTILITQDGPEILTVP
ncbi:type I methionyl aminopeptidase [Candidatus Aquiluna sp. UB-MaderosW2red]|uniref:type I methionyl aminopeptidase n=1 Tax=Candidatus Aquiluna sp. UB-MaderosW2red TaxID=1855377 RepID=UPI000875E2E5|nr:type I methionyl aminopeptidase [Candidatus Aquiluna sp. UB-MaderosW2red]SCX10983.1 methionyl aminopeptidase [Candidatus Aquiluna sp. UB-MaderosW2red]